MKTLTLSKVYGAGFSLSDIDLLVKHKRASFASKNGHTSVVMDVTECNDFLYEYFQFKNRR